jgi:hypothetical protein
MRPLLTIAACAAAMLLGSVPAQALYEGPWCAVQTVGPDSVVENCRMRTFEECRLEVVAGNRGQCTQNPRWPGWYGGGVAAGGIADVPRRVRKRRAR